MGIFREEFFQAVKQELNNVQRLMDEALYESRRMKPRAAGGKLAQVSKSLLAVRRGIAEEKKERGANGCGHAKGAR